MTQSFRNEPDLTLLLEAQIENLRSYYANYGATPFKPGDLVQPKGFSSHRYRDRPYIVLEVRPDAEPFFIMDDVTSNSNGRRLNIRVGAFVTNDYISEWWGEAHEFQEWLP